ncbi:hypothetical protein B7486_77770, partial [cyanobacterium TDX16]
MKADMRRSDRAQPANGHLGSTPATPVRVERSRRSPMMKKIFIPALALAAASVAVPAMAQSYGHQDRDGRGGYEQDRGRYDNNRGGDRGGRWDN